MSNFDRPHVQRWTAYGAKPTDAGGFVAYGDYLDAVGAVNRSESMDLNFAERHVQLGKFYAATDTDDLIDKMGQHIARLQDKVAALTPKFSFAPQIVRKG